MMPDHTAFVDGMAGGVVAIVIILIFIGLVDWGSRL